MEKRLNALPGLKEMTMDNSTTNYLSRLPTILSLLTLFIGVQAFGQVPLDENGAPIEALAADGEKFADAPYESDIEPLTAAELEQLVGPIALYPDDLLAIVLPASTYPLQIVQAARFLEAYAIDSTLEPDESWDESVVALINYPEVIELLNDEIDWTWRLGEAVISQQEDLVIAVESFRNRAYAAGNLKTDEYQNVIIEGDIIEIVPIEDDVIYVPYYEPERVVVYQPQPVYHYYERPYPVYYYPYPYGHSFSSGYFWGVTTAFRIGWATDHLHVHHASYWGHPYYGHHYYNHYYRRPSISVYNTVYVNNARRSTTHHYRDGDYWRPNRRAGARQTDYSAHTRHYRNDVERLRSSNTRTASTGNSRASTHSTTAATSFARSDRNREQRTNVRRTNSARATPNTANNGHRQRSAVTSTTASDRQLRPRTTTQTHRGREAAAVSLDERRLNRDNARRSVKQPEPRYVTRNSSGSQRQSAPRTHEPPKRSSSNRAPQREQRSQASQQRKSKPARAERSSGQRSEKPAVKSDQGRSKRSSTRGKRHDK
jgi:hypothetical protein